MNDDNRQSGVYIIELDHGWYYIGSALDLNYRKSRHLSDLRCQRHPNRHMQRRWDKHGIYTFTVAEYCHPDDLRTREQRWINKHYGKPLCLNISKDATAPMTGKTVSDETKAKRAATIKANPPQPITPLARQLMSQAKLRYWANKPRPPSIKQQKKIATQQRRDLKNQTKLNHQQLIQTIATQHHKPTWCHCHKKRTNCTCTANNN